MLVYVCVYIFFSFGKKRQQRDQSDPIKISTWVWRERDYTEGMEVEARLSYVYFSM